MLTRSFIRRQFVGYMEAQPIQGGFCKKVQTFGSRHSHLALLKEESSFLELERKSRLALEAELFISEELCQGRLSEKLLSSIACLSLDKKMIVKELQRKWVFCEQNIERLTKFIEPEMALIDGAQPTERVPPVKTTLQMVCIASGEQGEEGRLIQCNASMRAFFGLK